MEKYEKPGMEIVELINEVILTSVCGTPDTNEAGSLCRFHSYVPLIVRIIFK